PTRCKFIAFIPQWDFLNFMAERANAFPNFTLRTQAEAIDLIHDVSRIAGVLARSSSGTSEIRGDLVIAADGQHSTLRRIAGLEVEDQGAPMDVLWFKLARRSERDHTVLGRIEAGQALVMLDRGDYWQCALIIRKGTAEEVKAQGLEAFRARIAKLANRSSADEISSLEEVKLLTVVVDRLKTWHQPGFLCVGDPAHAMSPIRRGGHQPRHSGCNRCCKHSCRAAAKRPLRRAGENRGSAWVLRSGQTSAGDQREGRSARGGQLDRSL